MMYGYARVSTREQNLDRQLDALKEKGIEKIYEEKITGMKKDRPQLNKLLEEINPGDIVIVAELTRLSRSTKDLLNIAEILNSKSVELISLKENIDTTTATGRAMFGMLAVMAEFERNLIQERVMEGLQSARKRGRIGGRPKIDNRKIKLALKMYGDKSYSIREITDATGISKMTLYRYIKDKKNLEA